MLGQSWTRGFKQVMASLWADVSFPAKPRGGPGKKVGNFTEVYGWANRAAIIIPEHCPHMPRIWSLFSPPTTMALGWAPYVLSNYKCYPLAYLISLSPQPILHPSENKLCLWNSTLQCQFKITICLLLPWGHLSALMGNASFSSPCSPSKLILMSCSFKSSFWFSQVVMNSSDITFAPRNVTFLILKLVVLKLDHTLWTSTHVGC